MSIPDRIRAVSKRLRLDSHHSVERLAAVVAVFAVLGVAVLGSSAVSAAHAGREQLGERALYTETFTTSKTNLSGTVDGVYTSSARDRALVVMHFQPDAAISYDASTYSAWLLGADSKRGDVTVETEGVTGSVYVFGQSGYMGVLLEADRPFRTQVLNLTVRAGAELTYNDEEPSAAAASEDDTFAEFDQWRIYFNPAGSEATVIKALDAASLEPSRAYYEAVVAAQEAEVEAGLDASLAQMRTDLAQIESYTADLATTRVDGLFLREPEVPASVAGDEVTGATAAENATDGGDGTSTLKLVTDTVVPGGFDLDWRSGNVYDGYLDELTGSDGRSYNQLLSDKNEESAAAGDTSDTVSGMSWRLSDGTDLANDYSGNNVVVAPLITVMNNLSGAYQNYYSHKAEYQTSGLMELIKLDIDLRDVRANSSVRQGITVWDD